jgi:hypothetical protein
MVARLGSRRLLLGAGGAALAALALVLLAAVRPALAGSPWALGWWWHKHHQPCPPGGCGPGAEFAGQWYFWGSPEEMKQKTMDLYNRYCVRCHAVDGRGVWDVPAVPDFTNPRWQACRTDHQLVANIILGRGAVMPPFRGTLTLEEAWGMARYLRTFVPGTEEGRPDLGKPDKADKADKADKPGEAGKPAGPEMLPAPKKP